MIKFIMITNNPVLAKHAESCGVGRIFVDLELLGKKERQGHLDTLISNHSMADVKKIRSNISRAELLVRLNPLNEITDQEIDQAVSAGADMLMLPMFRRADEVRKFVKMVDGRAQVIPLVETYAASQAIEDIVQIAGVSEIYIGLNDLYLDMQLDFMFEPLANGLVDKMATVIKSAGLPFGFGGIARVGEGIIPGELVLGEHLRLGSQSVILSRTFLRKDVEAFGVDANIEFQKEIDKLSDAARSLKLRSSEQITSDQRRLQAIVADFVAGKKR